MDPDIPGLTPDDLNSVFGDTIRVAGEKGYQAFAVFLNKDVFKQEVGLWSQTNMNPDQLKEVLKNVLASLQ